jgi:hypothetical protein
MTKEDWVKRITELESQLPPAVEDGASWEKRLRRVVGATVSGSALVAWIEVCRAHGYPQPPPDMEGRWRICVQWASSIGDAPSVKIAELRTQANMRELARAAFAGDDLQGMKIELALMQWDGAMDRGIWDSWSLINSFTTSVTAPRP